MRLELYPFLADLAQFTQAEDLKSAAVRQDRMIPVHEAVQTAQMFYQAMPGPQIQMVGIGQDDLGIDRQKVFGGHGLDGRIGTHRHEYGGFNAAVESFQRAEPSPAGCIPVQYAEIG
jgi:hypothetical protein